MSERPRTPRPGSDAEDASPGRLIAGNFRIDALIGTGAMGSVYRAEQISLGKPVALKVLHRRLRRDERVVKRFRREAKSAAHLDHPNTVQVLDTGEDTDGTLYIAMELLTGRDLAAVIRDDFPLPLARVLHIARQVLSALDAAHAGGIVHRDLKPSNIMLVERGGDPDFVKVCDFGIAKLQDPRATRLTVQGVLCGTPEYVAPEQARGDEIDGRADLYAASIVLYQMVTGNVPFHGDSSLAILSRQLYEPPVPPRQVRPDLGIPPALDALIVRGLSKRPDARPQSARDYITQLEAISEEHLRPPPPDDRPTLPAQPTITPPPRRRVISMPALPVLDAEETETIRVPNASRRRKMLLGAGAGTAVLAAIAAGLWIGPGRPGQPSPSEVRLAAPPPSLPPSARERRVPPSATPLPLAPPAAPVLAAKPGNTAAPPASAPAPVPAAKPGNTAAPPAAGPPSPALPVPEPEARALPSSREARAQDPAEASPRAGGRRSRSEARDLPAAAATGRRAGGGSAEAVDEAKDPAAADGYALLTTSPPAPAGARPTAAAETAAVASDPVRASIELLGQAEKLLADGDVTRACARGEEAKRLAPTLRAYKFLGKCYLRAGDKERGSDNYRRYLELAPGASDADAIRSQLQ